MSRALALLRMALGIAVLADLARWAQDFRLFFTPHGLLPLRAAVADAQGGRVAFSLYNGSTGFAFPYLLFAATVLAALALTLGWRCRIAVPTLWLLLLSLQNHLAGALDSADRLLLVGLALAVMLPCDRVWSLSQDQPAHWFSRVLASLFLLLALLSGLLRWHAQPETLRQVMTFLALGPRAQATPGIWYIAIAQGIGDDRWTVGQRSRTALSDFSRPPKPMLEESYRRRLYLGSLANPVNSELRYWLAFRLYSDERATQYTIQSLSLYQCQVRGAQGVQATLWARWPMNGSQGIPTPAAKISP